MYFGERVAASYDDLYGRMFQPEAVDPAVSLLAELAGSGGALELAIAGLRLRDRWSGWNRELVPTPSHSHVSIWQKPEL